MPNPKLEYDAKTPAFLQRLKGQYGGVGERQNVQFARPKKQLIDTEDDGPTYVDGDSHETISKEAYEKLAEARGDDGNNDDEAHIKLSKQSQKDPARPGNESSMTAIRGPQAAFGSSNKRKAVKVVGNDDEAAERPGTGARSKTNEARTDASPPKSKPRPAKKSKKIKLSFDDD